MQFSEWTDTLLGSAESHRGFTDIMMRDCQRNPWLSIGLVFGSKVASAVADMIQRAQIGRIQR